MELGIGVMAQGTCLPTIGGLSCRLFSLAFLQYFISFAAIKRNKERKITAV
jgi:hypothetical protein